jgi:hypothetical protein
VNPDSDPFNCGRCGRRCEDDEVCQTGHCRKKQETACQDGKDNDEDGMRDCEDPDCEGTERPCEGFGDEVCSEGVERCQGDGTWSTCQGCEDLEPDPVTECTGDEQCRDTYHCQQQECVFDPSSEWNVVVVDATLPEHNTSGFPWDPFWGAPDAFVRASSGDKTGTTRRRADVYDPSWNHVVLERVKASDLMSSITFEIIDMDDFVNDFIGECTVDDLSKDEIEGDLLVLDCPRNEQEGNAGFRLRYRIEIPASVM